MKNTHRKRSIHQVPYDPSTTLRLRGWIKAYFLTEGKGRLTTIKGLCRYLCGLRRRNGRVLFNGLSETSVSSCVRDLRKPSKGYAETNLPGTWTRDESTGRREYAYFGKVESV